jgi:hypothetical protein
MAEGEVGRHVAHTGEMRSEYKILVEKLEGKVPLWRPRRKWADESAIFQSCIHCRPVQRCV